MTDRKPGVRFGEPTSGWSAAFTKLDLLDLIQLITLTRRTLVVCAQLEGASAVLAFRNGQLLHADCEGRSGEEAFFEVVQWERGIFEEVPTDPETFSANVVLPTEELVMEAARRRDEAEHEDSSDEARVQLEATPTLKNDLLGELMDGSEQLGAAWIVDRDGELLAAAGQVLPTETHRRALWTGLRGMLRMSSEELRMVIEDAGQTVVVRRLPEGRCLMAVAAAGAALGAVRHQVNRVTERLLGNGKAE